MQSRTMSLPLPPGNYVLVQGIPCYLVIMREGATRFVDDEIACIYQGEGKVGARQTGDSFDSGPMIRRFAQLPPGLQEAVTARFTELFALDIGTTGNSPRGDRSDYYKLHPSVVTVK